MLLVISASSSSVKNDSGMNINSLIESTLENLNRNNLVA